MDSADGGTRHLLEVAAQTDPLVSGSRKQTQAPKVHIAGIAFQSVGASGRGDVVTGKVAYAAGDGL